MRILRELWDLVFAFVHSIYITKIQSGSSEYRVLGWYYGKDLNDMQVTTCNLREAILFRVFGGKKNAIRLLYLAVVLAVLYCVYIILSNLLQFLLGIVLGTVRAGTFLFLLWTAAQQYERFMEARIYHGLWETRIFGIPYFMILAPIMVGAPYALAFEWLYEASAIGLLHYVVGISLLLLGILWVLAMVCMMFVQFFGIFVIVIAGYELYEEGKVAYDTNSLLQDMYRRDASHMVRALRQGEQVCRAGIATYNTVCRKLEIV